MRLLPSPLWTPNGWFPLTDSEAWFGRLLAADSGPLPPGVTAGPGTSSTANANTYTSDSFTPAEGELLVVIAGITATVTAPACTASANGITFTRVVGEGWSAGAHRHAIFVANELVPASPSSMTVTVDVTGDAGSGANIAVLRVQGMQRTGTAAVRQATALTNVVGTGGAYDLGFAAATLSSNIVILSLANNSNPAGITPPTGFTETHDIGYDTPSAGLEVCYDLTGGYTTRTFGSTSATIGTANGIELDTSAPSGATDVDLTPSTETDTAQTVARGKARVLSPATQTDTAVTVARVKARAAAPAAETDTTVTVSRVKARTLGQATETDTAVVVGRVSTRALAAVSETDTVVSQGARKSRTPLSATETEAAVPVTGGLISPTGVDLTPAAETDTVLGLSAAKAWTVAAAAETSNTTTVGHRKSRSVTAAVEFDTVPVVGRVKSRSLSVAVETDTTVTVGHARAASITPAVETTTPVGITAKKTRAVTPATEVDTAAAVTPARARVLGVAVETDTAFPVRHVITRTLVPASEASTAPAVTAVKLQTVTPAAEVDTAVRLRRDITVISVAESTQRQVTFTEAAARAVVFTPAERAVGVSEAARPVTFTEAPARAVMFEEQPQ